MNGESDLQSLERFVVDNDELLLLEEQVGRFNIFDALGVARAEIRHSNFLAWLISPNESHSQGDLFLKALLMDLLRRARQQGLTPPVSPVEIDGADLQGVEIRREWKNIDLLLTSENPSFVIAVENKVDSGEHSDQLQRYEETIAVEFPQSKRLLVFLTPEGDEASDPDWVTYSYGDLYQVLTRAMRMNAAAIGGDVAVFLGHYLSLIGNRFMDNEDIDKLCRQIYANHRRALELIWERVGTPAAGIIGRVEAWLQERPEQWRIIQTKQKEVEFIPVGWARMLPPIGKRKSPDSENWITVRIRVGSTRVRLLVVIAPTTNSPIRKKVAERLLKDKKEFGFSTFFKKLTDDWTRILSDELYKLPEDDEPDHEAIIQRIEKRLEQFREQAAGVPAALRAVLKQ
jgi:hypothetical protein